MGPALAVYEDVLGADYPHHVVHGTVGLWSKYPIRHEQLVDIRPRAFEAGWSRGLRAVVRTPYGDVAAYVAHLPSVRAGVRGLASSPRDESAPDAGGYRPGRGSRRRDPHGGSEQHRRRSRAASLDLAVERGRARVRLQLSRRPSAGPASIRSWPVPPTSAISVRCPPPAATTCPSPPVSPWTRSRPQAVLPLARRPSPPPRSVGARSCPPGSRTCPCRPSSSRTPSPGGTPRTPSRRPAAGRGAPRRRYPYPYPVHAIRARTGGGGGSGGATGAAGTGHLWVRRCAGSRTPSARPPSGGSARRACRRSDSVTPRSSHLTAFPGQGARLAHPQQQLAAGVAQGEQYPLRPAQLRRGGGCFARPGRPPVPVPAPAQDAEAEAVPEPPVRWVGWVECSSHRVLPQVHSHRPTEKSVHRPSGTAHPEAVGRAAVPAAPTAPPPATAWRVPTRPRPASAAYC